MHALNASVSGAFQPDPGLQKLKRSIIAIQKLVRHDPALADEHGYMIPEQHGGLRRGRRRDDILCETCREAFSPKHDGRRYCSRACYGAALAAKHEARKAAL